MAHALTDTKWPVLDPKSPPCAGRLALGVRKVLPDFFAALLARQAKPPTLEVAFTKWLGREKRANPAPLAEDFADLVNAILRSASEQGFTQRKLLTRPLRLELSDGTWSTVLDLEKMAVSHGSVMQARTEMFNLGRLRDLRLRFGRSPRATDLTPLGLRLDKPLKEFAEISDIDLQFRLYSSPRPDDLTAIALTTELLLRAGFVVEPRVTGKSVYVARILGRIDGKDNQFMRTIRRLENETGAYFAFDPTYYFYNSAAGVSDTSLGDLSLETRRLWRSPADFTANTSTLLHEIHHLTNAFRWLMPDNDEAHNALNGWLESSREEDLTDEFYKHYFQLDEITAYYRAAVLLPFISLNNPSENYDVESRIREYHKTSRALIAAVLTRLDKIRAKVARHEFKREISSYGSFLNVGVELPPVGAAGGSTFTYRFLEFSERTSDVEITDRFLNRLNLLETHLRRLDSQMASTATVPN